MIKGSLLVNGSEERSRQQYNNSRDLSRNKIKVRKTKCQTKNLFYRKQVVFLLEKNALF